MDRPTHRYLGPSMWRVVGVYSSLLSNCLNAVISCYYIADSHLFLQLIIDNGEWQRWEASLCTASTTRRCDTFLNFDFDREIPMRFKCPHRCSLVNIARVPRHFKLLLLRENITLILPINGPLTYLHYRALDQLAKLVSFFIILKSWLCNETAGLTVNFIGKLLGQQIDHGNDRASEGYTLLLTRAGLPFYALLYLLTDTAWGCLW